MTSQLMMSYKKNYTKKPTSLKKLTRVPIVITDVNFIVEE